MLSLQAAGAAVRQGWSLTGLQTAGRLLVLPFRGGRNDAGKIACFIQPFVLESQRMHSLRRLAAAGCFL